MNIELYTAQIFPLLPQQLLQWFQQQLQLDFEGGEGTGGSYQPAASKGAPTHCFQRDFTSREVGQGEATSRRTALLARFHIVIALASFKPLGQSGGFSPQPIGKLHSTSVIGGGKFKPRRPGAEN